MSIRELGRIRRIRLRKEELLIHKDQEYSSNGHRCRGRRLKNYKLHSSRASRAKWKEKRQSTRRSQARKLHFKTNRLLPPRIPFKMLVQFNQGTLTDLQPMIL